MRDWIGFAFGVSCLAAAVAWEVFGDRITAPVPYGNVQVFRAEWVEDGFALSATFDKYKCEPSRLRVISSIAGVTQFHEWSDLDLVGEDRQAGEQTLRLVFDVPRDDYEWIELRTTHLCPSASVADPVRVDKVFARITNP